jgi:hypothetical protein
MLRLARCFGAFFNKLLAPNEEQEWHLSFRTIVRAGLRPQFTRLLRFQDSASLRPQPKAEQKISEVWAAQVTGRHGRQFVSKPAIPARIAWGFPVSLDVTC